ncbi:MAG: RecX family transcriptional regulator [Tannerella sp.]|jgi:regulatory protein|nr:RecX family transcriptional regulator [Tannerella sp.]
MKTEDEMLKKMADYCTRTERCISDVRKKIRYSELPPEAEERIISRLVHEKFIDEERFAKSFVNDMLRFNHWGRVKIAYELKFRNIRPQIYGKALEAIDENEYQTILSTLLNSKLRTTKGRPNEVFQKLLRFASTKGFETSLIIKTLKGILKNVDYEQFT